MLAKRLKMARCYYRNDASSTIAGMADSLGISSASARSCICLMANRAEGSNLPVPEAGEDAGNVSIAIGVL
jgi:hypothetical protein